MQVWSFGGDLFRNDNFSLGFFPSSFLYYDILEGEQESSTGTDRWNWAASGR